MSNTASPRRPVAGAVAGQRGGDPARRSPRTCCSTRQIDREYLRRWVNWRDLPRATAPGPAAATSTRSSTALTDDYADYTFEFAAAGGAASRSSRSRELAEIVADGGVGAVGTHLALRGGRQPRRLAGGALPVLPQRAHRQRRHAGRHQPQRLGQVHRRTASTCPRAHDGWNELLWPAEYPLSTNEMSILLPHFLSDGPRRARRLLHPGLQPDLDQPRRVLLDRGADRHRPGRAARRADARPGRRPRRSPTTCCRWATPPSGTTLTPTRPTPARWLGFRQPVRRVAMDKLGTPVRATPGTPTRARCGRRTSSGSSCRGGSTRTARWASGATSSRRTGRARRSRWTSTTAGSSRTGCPACRRRPPRRD